MHYHFCPLARLEIVGVLTVDAGQKAGHHLKKNVPCSENHALQWLLTVWVEIRGVFRLAHN